MNNQNYPLASLDNKKISVPIFGLPAVLGRNENTVDVYFFHESVSREHCIFEFINNRLTIRDLGSTAGTFVNGVRLNPEMPYYIDDGDKVKIGKVKFIFHANYQALSAMVQDMMNAGVNAEPIPEASDFSESVYREDDGIRRVVIEAVELNDYEYDESEVEFIDIGLEAADRPRSYTNQIKKAEIEAALAEQSETKDDDVKETEPSNVNTPSTDEVESPETEESKYEIADLLYHLMVLMAEKGITWDDVMTELANR